MSYTDETRGRLGNQIIRNLALSLVAKKNNLHVDYSNYSIINNQLGIQLFIGDIKYNSIRRINNSNYLKLYYQNESIDYNLNFNEDYFQSEEITSILYQHLHSDQQKSNIIEHNPFKSRYNNNKDLFIHIRLGDLQHCTPKIKYYFKALKNIPWKRIYLATDSPEHKLIKRIKLKYPRAIVIKKEPVETIQFGSTCKYVVLSIGSFSALIGYLSFFSNIYYTNIPRPGRAGPLGLFTNKGWKII